MDDVDELGNSIEHLISELQEITQSLKSDIANQEKSVSFEQVKEIEGAILRLSRQGLPIPAELKELKLKLFSAHEHHKNGLSFIKDFRPALLIYMKKQILEHQKGHWSLIPRPLIILIANHPISSAPSAAKETAI